MITIIEKRIQELENRIPVFIAQIQQQQEKMKEIYDFPNDLTELRKICDRLTILLQDNQTRSLQSFADMTNKNNSHENKLQDLLKKIDAFNTSFENHAAEMKRQNAFIEEIALLCKEVSSRNSMNENSLKSLLPSISSLQSDKDNISTRLYNLQMQCESFKNFLSKISDLIALQDNNYISILDSQKKLKENIDISIQNHSSEIAQLKNVIEVISKKTNEKSSQVDYSSEISDLKKDISSVLTFLHSSSSNIPDQFKLNEKIKTMENSIAQIYSLMKKYETKA